jgi:hypothetical protein
MANGDITALEEGFTFSNPRRNNARSGPVKNWVLANREDFADRHYTMKADPGRNYFFNLRPSVRDRLCDIFGADFLVVIAGDEDAEDDFWAIPFPRIADLFTEKTLTKHGSANPGRWSCDIVRGQLHLFPGMEGGQRGSVLGIDISDCYGDRSRLD